LLINNFKNKIHNQKKLHYAASNIYLFFLKAS